jgi:hypothetical protein
VTVQSIVSAIDCCTAALLLNDAKRSGERFVCVKV